MVSLIDSDRQYILAEATRTLSLLGHSAEKPEDEVWLGNTIIARNDAVCHHCFNSTYTALEQNGDEYKTKCMVISDCREDPRFSDRDYVTGEPGVRFYAGVPITTKSGYQIGVYAVSDEKPRDCLSANDVRFMEDVAAAVMEHLELAKKADDRHNGERMVRGLAEFIERSSSLEARSDSSDRTTMEKQTENARLAALPDDTPRTMYGLQQRNKPGSANPGVAQTSLAYSSERHASFVNLPMLKEPFSSTLLLRESKAMSLRI
jgi:GAF domain-containing protein